MSKEWLSLKAEARRRPKVVKAENSCPSSTKYGLVATSLDYWTCSLKLSLAFRQGTLGRFSLYKMLNSSL